MPATPCRIVGNNPQAAFRAAVLKNAAQQGQKKTALIHRSTPLTVVALYATTTYDNTKIP